MSNVFGPWTSDLLFLGPSLHFRRFSFSILKIFFNFLSEILRSSVWICADSFPKSPYLQLFYQLLKTASIWLLCLRSTSDMRVQVELVDSLEHRLTKERNRLQAMMQHLHMKQSPDTTTPTIGKVNIGECRTTVYCCHLDLDELFRLKPTHRHYCLQNKNPHFRQFPRFPRNPQLFRCV